VWLVTDRVLGNVCVRSGDVHTWPFSPPLSILTNSLFSCLSAQAGHWQRWIRIYCSVIFSFLLLRNSIQSASYWIQETGATRRSSAQWMCTCISAQCLVWFNINTKEVAGTVDIPATFISRRRQNF
jgi:hypothetical protein